VDHRRTGGEADFAPLKAPAFDLMIVDIFMPHMRGFESIRIFHERAPTIPLVAMSGYALLTSTRPAPDLSEDGSRTRCNALLAQAVTRRWRC